MDLKDLITSSQKKVGVDRICLQYIKKVKKRWTKIYKEFLQVIQFLQDAICYFEEAVLFKNILVLETM